jgi:hypothetical protein
MARDYRASERLRDFVRARVRKDGAHYEWGNGARLAEAIGIDPGWVTAYADRNPSRHADFDQALAICAFYGVNPLDFASKTPQVIAPTAPAIAQAIEDWEREIVLLAGKFRQQLGSATGSSPADQEAGGEKRRKRGRTAPGAGGRQR